MALISEDHKLLFILNPRTASTATSLAIYKHLNAHWIPSSDIVDENGDILIQKKHSTVNQLYGAGLITKNQKENYLKVVVVRNPFDSLYSLYIKKRFAYQNLRNDKTAFIHKIPNFDKDLDFVKNHTFSEWIIKNYQKPYKLKGKTRVNLKWAGGCDLIMKFENLDQEFESFSKRLGLDVKIDIPRKNITEGKKTEYREAYTNEAREIMEFLLRNELKKLKYKF